MSSLHHDLTPDDEAEPATPARPWPYPLWFAHRGAGRHAPENTLAAMRLGASLGWRAFECDVRLSADGLPFLLHDDTLERTTDAAGAALELDWAELSLLDAGGWHGRIFAGEPLPSLDGIAAFILRNGHALNIELKPAPGDEERTGRLVAQAVRRLWGEAVHDEQAVWPLLSSFRPEALAAAREAAPELPRALLVETLWPDCIDIAERLGCSAMVLEQSVITPELIGRLHRDGLRVLAYTVNDPGLAGELIELGIDGLISDEVDRFVPAD